MREVTGTTVLLSLLVLALAAAPSARAHPGHGDGAAAAPPPPDALAVTHFVQTGSGDNAYQTVPNWCQIPADRNGTLGPTHGGVVIDKKGLIYFSMDGGPIA